MSLKSTPGYRELLITICERIGLKPIQRVLIYTHRDKNCSKELLTIHIDRFLPRHSLSHRNCPTCPTWMVGGEKNPGSIRIYVWQMVMNPMIANQLGKPKGTPDVKTFVLIDEIPQNTLEILTWVLKMITWKSNSNKLATLDTCPSKFKGVMKSHKKNYHCSLPIAKKTSIQSKSKAKTVTKETM